MTLHQAVKVRALKKKKSTQSTALESAPQKKGLCLKVYSLSPKKPNSAERKVAKIRLTTNKIVSCYIPGEKHTLQEHGLVLIRGGGTKDLPGVHYKLIRGILDLNAVSDRKQSRSKYGRKRQT